MTHLKTLILAAITFAATASLASAHNAFPFGKGFEQADVLALDFVRDTPLRLSQADDLQNNARDVLLGSNDTLTGITSNVVLGGGANHDVLTND